jgi:hypothetical protein
LSTEELDRKILGHKGNDLKIFWVTRKINEQLEICSMSIYARLNYSYYITVVPQEYQGARERFPLTRIAAHVDLMSGPQGRLWPCGGIKIPVVLLGKIVEYPGLTLPNIIEQIVCAIQFSHQLLLPAARFYPVDHSTKFSGVTNLT